jgi:hypothetical protein
MGREYVINGIGDADRVTCAESKKAIAKGVLSLS